ncbi:MAG: hypothetical protein ACPGVU_15745 [Limisphaerales bacterium]
MPLLDTGYHHYDETYLGVWYRRAVISWNGMRALLANKWVKRIVGVCWLLCFVQTAVLFAIGQLLVPESFINDYLGMLGRGEQSFVGRIEEWLTEHPEVSVHTIYNFLFFQFANWISFFSYVLLAIVVPQLITIDFSSRALLVYSSKALNRFDYFLGKFGIAFGMLTCVWLGPILVAWFFGNLLAPDWTFFIHSSRALANVVLYVVSSMAILSLIALGVSACSAKEKATTSLWIGFWIVGGVFGQIGGFTKPWLQNISIAHNLDQLAVYVFRLKQDLYAAAEVVPGIGKSLANFDKIPAHAKPPFLRDPEMEGAMVGLVLMVGIALLIVTRKVRPEST